MAFVELKQCVRTCWAVPVWRGWPSLPLVCLGGGGLTAWPERSPPPSGVSSEWSSPSRTGESRSRTYHLHNIPSNCEHISVQTIQHTSLNAKILIYNMLTAQDFHYVCPWNISLIHFCPISGTFFHIFLSGQNIICRYSNKLRTNWNCVQKKSAKILQCSSCQRKVTASVKEREKKTRISLKAGKCTRSVMMECLHVTNGFMIRWIVSSNRIC